MAFSVNEFRQQLSAGGARPSLFEVELTAPAALTNTTALNNFKFFCKIAQLPESTFGVVEVPYFGRKVKVAGDRVFNELSLTIINDEDYEIYNAHERWMHNIALHQQETQSRATALGADDYLGSAVIRQFAKTGEVIKQINVVNMFPTTLGAVDLSWETTDTIMEFAVTYQYDWWESDQSGGGQSTSGLNINISL